MGQSLWALYWDEVREENTGVIMIMIACYMERSLDWVVGGAVERLQVDLFADLLEVGLFLLDELLDLLEEVVEEVLVLVVVPFI